MSGYISYRSADTELTVADIFRDYWDEYRQQHPVTAQQAKVVGSMMAAETLKVIARSGDVLRNHMLIYDALYGETRKIALQKRNDCPICGNSE